jgi:Leucine-rich repeat (LRR) protein
MKQLLLICAVVALVGCGQSNESSGPPSVTPKAISEKESRDPEPSVTPKTLLKKPLTKEELERHAKVIEAVIRFELEKPTGELTKLDLEKVTKLDLSNKQLTEVPKELEKLTQLEWLRLDYNQLTDLTGLEKLTQLRVLNLHYNKLTNVKGLEKLTKLRELWLDDNPDLTKAQIAELQKALPNCKISSNPTK